MRLVSERWIGLLDLAWAETGLDSDRLDHCD